MSTRTAFTVVGAVVGAVVGFYTGNVALGFQIGTAIGGLVGNEVDPVKLYGPRLGDAKFQSCRDGVPIPWGIGRFRVTGTIIACQPGPPTETEAESREGKGSGPVNVNYNYTRTHAILICEGEILGVRRIWRDNKLVYDTSEQPTTANSGLTGTDLENLLQQWLQLRAQATSFASKIRLYNGSETQLPDSALEAIFGVGNVSAHRGTAYMVVVDDDVTARGGSIPQYDFEVVVAGTTQAVETVGGNSEWHVPSSYTGMTYDEDGARFTGENVGIVGARANAGRSAGKLYFEVLSNPLTGLAAGVISGDRDLTGFFPSYVAAAAGDAWIIINSGDCVSGVEADSGGHLASVSNPDTVGIAVDLDNGKFWFSRDGVFEGDPVAGTGQLFSAVDGIVYPWACCTGAGRATIRLRADEFLTAPPTGFSAWGPDMGTPLPDATEFGVDEDGNIIYDGTTPVPDSLIPTTPTVQQALELIAARTGATPDMYDFSALASEDIEGFFVAREAQGDAVTNAIGQGYFFDCAEWDGKIRAVPRGENSVLTIDIDDLAKREGAPVSEMREQEIERPRKLNVIYSDPAMNYIPTKQTAERTTATISAIGERTIELAIVMDKNRAAQIADKAIKVTWTDLLGTVTFDLPDAFSYLTPTDIIILSYRGKNQRLRIDAIAYDVGRMSVSCRQDRQSCYTSDVEGVGTPPDLPVAGLLGVTRFVFVNTYPLRDADDKFGFYVAATGLLPNWPGAIIQWSIDDGASWTDGGTVYTKGVIGTLVDPLPAALAAVRDYSNTLRVYLGDRTVSSITAEQLLQEQNAAAIVAADGSVEIVQFQTATAEGDGVFALTTLARGRNGTGAVLHAVDETFVLLSDATFIETPVSLLGKQIKVRAVTRGTAAGNNAEYDQDFTTALIQTEHAPAWMTSYRVGSDVSLYWAGSGLFGTPANSFTGTKFGGYQLTFSDGVTSVVKTSPGASYIYSGTDQTTDFGAPVTVGNLDVEIRQINTITGVGPALTETI